MKLFLGIFLALVIPIAGTIMTDAPVIWPVSTLIYNLGLLYSFALVPQKETLLDFSFLTTSLK